MSGLLSAYGVSVCHHIFTHIFIAHCCLLIADTFPVAGLIKPQIRHNRSDNSIVVQLSAFLHIFSADIHNQIAVYFLSLIIHRNTPVSISVIGKAHIQMVFHYKFLQFTDMGGTAVSVDIGTIRLIMNHICLCS